MRSPRTICRWSTSFGKAAGKMARCCVTARAAGSPIRPGFTRSSMTGRISASRRSILPSHRRSARRCCTRPAPRRVGGSLLPSTPSACSSTDRRSGSLRRSSRTSAAGPRPLGRDPAEILIFTMMTVITDTTAERARDKHADYLRYVSTEGALTLMSGWTGVDFAKLPLDEPIRFGEHDAMTSALEAFTIADPNRTWTVREIAHHAAIGGRGPVVVGSPSEIADELQAWVEETDVDGFNLAYAVTPETFTDFVATDRAGVAAARRVQAGVCARHAAREAVWRRAGPTAGEPSGGAHPRDPSENLAPARRSRRPDGCRRAARASGADQAALSRRSRPGAGARRAPSAGSTRTRSPARSPHGTARPAPGCTRPPAGRARSPARPTCCWRRWSPAPARR